VLHGDGPSTEVQYRLGWAWTNLIGDGSHNEQPAGSLDGHRGPTRSPIVAAGHVHRVAHRGSVEHHRAVVPGNSGLERDDSLVAADGDDLHAAGDRVTGAHRRLEIPVGIEEHRSRAWQSFGHNGIEDRAGDTALDHDFAESRCFGGSFVVMQGVAVTTDQREQGNVAVTNDAGQLSDLTDKRSGVYRVGPAGWGQLPVAAAGGATRGSDGHAFSPYVR